MFRFKSLELVHWDYWQRFEIPLNGEIITTVGPNGSGKTTLLDSFRTLLNIPCSKKRDYKRYVRRNGAPFAWLRAVLSNERNKRGRSPFFPITTSEVTIACNIKKDGGDWKRQYIVVGGNVSISELESRDEWLGPRDYDQRLEMAGLTRAIKKVLALEQGETDKLCEYSSRELLALVFDVFGDKEVLDQYAQAKVQQTELKRELDEYSFKLSQGELDVEKLNIKKSRFLEWKRLVDEVAELSARTIPALQMLGQRDGVLAAKSPISGYRRECREKRLTLAVLEQQKEVLQSSRDHLNAEVATISSENKKLSDQFGELRQAIGRAEALVNERKRLEGIVSAQEGLNAAQSAIEVAEARQKCAKLEAQLEEYRGNRAAMAREESVLTTGRGFTPEFVAEVRREFDRAKIRHTLLTEIVEVTDPDWQAAVEAVLHPSRHVIMLADESDERKAWEIGERLKYRHFVVPDRGDVSQIEPKSLRAVVRFLEAPPAWLARLLNDIHRVKSVGDGAQLQRNVAWITPDGYHRERRGGRHIGVNPGDFQFGNAGRRRRLENLTIRGLELDRIIGTTAAEITKLQAKIGRLQSLLDGMSAAKELAARNDEFDSAQKQFVQLQASGIEIGIKLADQTTRENEATAQRIALQGELSGISSKVEQISADLRRITLELHQRREAMVDQIINYRRARQSLASYLPTRGERKDWLRALREQYKNETFAIQIRDDKARKLAEETWEKDDSIILRCEKLRHDTEILKKEVQARKENYDRAVSVTDSARGKYIDVLRATVRQYSKNLRALGGLAGIDVETEMPHLENDDLVLGQAGLEVKFNFDQKGLIGLDDGEASGGQQVMKSLIMLIGLLMDEGEEGGFVFIDEPFAHLDIFNIERVGRFLTATKAQYVITTPVTHNANVYVPSMLTLITAKKRAGMKWAPTIVFARKRPELRMLNSVGVEAVRASVLNNEPSPPLI